VLCRFDTSGLFVSSTSFSWSAEKLVLLTQWMGGRGIRMWYALADVKSIAKPPLPYVPFPVASVTRSRTGRFCSIHRKYLVCTADKAEVAMDIQMWDASADAGKGALLASGTLQLQWAEWQQGAIHRHTIRLQGAGEYKVRETTRLG